MIKKQIHVEADLKDQAFVLNRRGVNLDITHRCSLECPRCQDLHLLFSKELRFLE